MSEELYSSGSKIGAKERVLRMLSGTEANLVNKIYKYT